MDSRAAVMDWLTDAFEGHAIQEQVKLARIPEVAEAHHKAGLFILAGARLSRNATPSPKAPCGCIQCAALYAAAGS